MSGNTPLIGYYEELELVPKPSNKPGDRIDGFKTKDRGVVIRYPDGSEVRSSYDELTHVITRINGEGTVEDRNFGVVARLARGGIVENIGECNALDFCNGRMFKYGPLQEEYLMELMFLVQRYITRRGD